MFACGAEAGCSFSDLQNMSEAEKEELLVHIVQFYYTIPVHGVDNTTDEYSSSCLFCQMEFAYF